MSGWQTDNNTLSKEYTFKDFTQAISFVDKIAVIANQLNHHPDILIYSYKHVKVITTTHDQGNSITKKDYTLAEKIDNVD